MTLAEITTAFQTQLSTFKRGKTLQSVLLSVAATGDTLLATKRCLSLLEYTELRPLFLATYPTYELDPALISSVTSITDIQHSLLPYKNVAKRAVQELNNNFPRETLELLDDYLVKESPLYYVATIIFIVTSMVLIEAGEL